MRGKLERLIELLRILDRQGHVEGDTFDGQGPVDMTRSGCRRPQGLDAQIELDGIVSKQVAKRRDCPRHTEGTSLVLAFQ